MKKTAVGNAGVTSTETGSLLFSKQNPCVLPAPIPGSHSIGRGAALWSSHLTLLGSPVEIGRRLEMLLSASQTLS